MQYSTLLQCIIVILLLLLLFRLLLLFLVLFLLLLLLLGLLLLFRLLLLIVLFLLLHLLLLPLALQPTVGFGLSHNIVPFFSYLSLTLSIFSLLALEDLFLFHLSILSCVFSFVSPLTVLE